MMDTNNMPVEAVPMVTPDQVYPDDWTHDVNPNIMEEIISINAKLDYLLDQVAVVVNNVKPAIDGLAASPLGRMFGMENPND